MRYISVLCCCFVLVHLGCSPKKPVDRMDDEQLKAYANELAHQFIIIDGHVDLPYRLTEEKFTGDSAALAKIIKTDQGDFDYERAKKGGLSSPFMSIYIPAGYQQHPDMGKNLADSLINIVELMVKTFPDKFALARSPSSIDSNFKAGKISLPMGMENGAPVGNNLKNVQYFYDRGIRYITLTHSKDNQICDSSGDTTHTWNGLSAYGREVVAEMNRVGIMVDISHVDDSTFYQVMKLTKAPAIASHSSCRHFAPTVRRDMTDDMIKKLGENDGVMMINYYTAFLDSVVVKSNTLNDQKLKAMLKEKGLSEDDSLALPLIELFKKENPGATTDIEMVVNHIDHAVKLAGIDHVGIGSDYDGVDGKLPVGLEDVSSYPNLIYALLKRGYTEEDIEKICYKNISRVWNRVIEVSSELKTKS